jgi:hypothetical protein
MQEFTSDIQFRCPNCQHFNQQTVVVPQLNFMAEKTSDMSVDDSIELECDGCEIIYSGTVFVHIGSTSFQIDEPHAFEFNGDMPMYGPDPDEYIPDDPSRIAEEALTTLKTMVGKMPVPPGDQQFSNRLIFAGAISAFEVYLNDTVLRAVQEDHGVFSALATKNSHFKDIRLTVVQLVTQPELAKTTVIRHLSDLIYHNLKVVITIYQDAFAFDILPEKDQRDAVFQAISNRHDCVHRNGCDKDGNRLELFDEEYVCETIDKLINAIDYIEKQVNEVLYRLDFLPA